MAAMTCALFHSALALNTPCPFCHWINNPSAGSFGMPGILSQQAQDPPNQAQNPPGQAQYTSTAPETVANLRQTIGSGNAYRGIKASAALTTPGTPPPLSVTKFYVRVAHAYYSDTTRTTPRRERHLGRTIPQADRSRHENPSRTVDPPDI